MKENKRYKCFKTENASYTVASFRLVILPISYPFVVAVTPERLTPKQHNAPHIVGKFSSVSCMSLAPPRRILDGENAEVFVTDVTVIYRIFLCYSCWAILCTLVRIFCAL